MEIKWQKQRKKMAGGAWDSGQLRHCRSCDTVQRARRGGTPGGDSRRELNRREYGYLLSEEQVSQSLWRNLLVW